METGEAHAPQWRSRRALEQHFRQHARQLGVRDLAEYDRSARTTIDDGICLTYSYVDPADPGVEEPRVGYFDPTTGRFTALTEDERLILTHFAATESYVRNLPDSSYG